MEALENMPKKLGKWLLSPSPQPFWHCTTAGSDLSGNSCQGKGWGKAEDSRVNKDRLGGEKKEWNREKRLKGFARIARPLATLRLFSKNSENQKWCHFQLKLKLKSRTTLWFSMVWQTIEGCLFVLQILEHLMVSYMVFTCCAIGFHQLCHRQYALHFLCRCFRHQWAMKYISDS